MHRALAPNEDAGAIGREQGCRLNQVTQKQVIATKAATEGQLAGLEGYFGASHMGKIRGVTFVVGVAEQQPVRFHCHGRRRVPSGQSGYVTKVGPICYWCPSRRSKGPSMRTMLAVAILALTCTAAAAQHQPYVGLASRSVKTLLDEQIADLKAGRGMGLALAAELNGYPGPSHAVELAGPLGLSGEQVTALKALFAAMKAETIPIGETLIAQEQGLNRAFAEKAITPAALDESTRQIGATQASLRAAHLKYHLSTATILTPAQIARYAELRGYGGSAPAHHQPMHR